MLKNNQILRGLIVGVVILIAIGGYFLLKSTIWGTTKVAYGYSVKDTEIGAVEEAVSMITAELARPDYAILFSTVGYDSETILGEVNRLLPDTKVYGGTSVLAVITKDGWHQGARGSLAMLAVSSPKITFGVGGVDLDDYTLAEEAGKAAIQNAIENAEKEDEFPQLVLMTSSPGNEEAILRGIEEVIGWGIPVIGGSAGDNDLTGKWKQFVNDEVYSNGLSLTAIFTDLKIGYTYETGYERSENYGVITRAEGRVIYEIDEMPAAEVYNEWCEGCITEKLGEGGRVLSETVFWPLAKVIETRTGTYYLPIHPLSINAVDKSLTVFANVMRGDEILLMHGEQQLLLERTEMTSHRAMLSKGISKEESIFGIYTYYAETMLAIPEEERSKMVELINEGLGNVPFIGTFTFGEQGPLGIVNYHGNLVDSMIVFSEK